MRGNLVYSKIPLRHGFVKRAHHPLTDNDAASAVSWIAVAVRHSSPRSCIRLESDSKFHQVELEDSALKLGVCVPRLRPLAHATLIYTCMRWHFSAMLRAILPHTASSTARSSRMRSVMTQTSQRASAGAVEDAPQRFVLSPLVAEPPLRAADISRSHSTFH